MICDKVHECEPELADLPEDQGGPGRHICAGCAYDKGREDGRARREACADLSSLPESQRGMGRHKSAYMAYEKGYRAGLDEFYGRRGNS